MRPFTVATQRPSPIHAAEAAPAPGAALGRVVEEQDTALVAAPVQPGEIALGEKGDRRARDRVQQRRGTVAGVMGDDAHNPGRIRLESEISAPQNPIDLLQVGFSGRIASRGGLADASQPGTQRQRGREERRRVDKWVQRCRVAPVRRPPPGRKIVSVREQVDGLAPDDLFRVDQIQRQCLTDERKPLAWLSVAVWVVRSLNSFSVACRHVRLARS
jgi:hypothetical protein